MRDYPQESFALYKQLKTENQHLNAENQQLQFKQSTENDELRKENKQMHTTINQLRARMVM